MTTQIQETAALVCALVVGYGIGRYRQHKFRHRCVSLEEWNSVSDQGVQLASGTMRCEQDQGHTGPHGARRRDGRYHWWNETTTSKALDDSP